MDELDMLTKLVMELQAIAQSGLTYTKDIFDKERFERIREISAQVRFLFCVLWMAAAFSKTMKPLAVAFSRF